MCCFVSWRYSKTKKGIFFLEDDEMIEALVNYAKDMKERDIKK